MEYIVGLIIVGAALWYFFGNKKETEVVTEVIVDATDSVAKIVEATPFPVEEAKPAKAKKPTVKKATTRKPVAKAKAPAKKTAKPKKATTK